MAKIWYPIFPAHHALQQPDDKNRFLLVGWNVSSFVPGPEKAVPTVGGLGPGEDNSEK